MKTPRITFVLIRSIGAVSARLGATIVALRQTAWDDYGYRTTFEVYVSAEGAAFKSIGIWKILDSAAVVLPTPRKTTQLPLECRSLPPRFVSIAQDPNNYDVLMTFGFDLARDVLKGLRDCALLPNDDLGDTPGYTRSLFRFISAHSALAHGRELFGPHRRRLDGRRRGAEAAQVAVSVSCHIAGFKSPHILKLEFSRDANTLSMRRMCAVIGRNGSGKTLLLGALASSLSGLEVTRATITPRPAFSSIIAISYSPWDEFVRPKGEGNRIPYLYCGLREVDRPDEDKRLTLDVDRARQFALHDLSQIRLSSTHFSRWQRALHQCGFIGRETPLAAAIQNPTGDLVSALKVSSAGEQLVIIAITRLVRHLQRGTLVLFDEPEVHLHPALLSSMLRVIHELLVERDAFALLATHSPVPLQEIPARCVQILDVIDGFPQARLPDRECFGASLGEIVAEVFRARPEDQNFESHVIKLLTSGKRRDDITTALGGRPSLGLELLLASVGRHSVKQ